MSAVHKIFQDKNINVSFNWNNDQRSFTLIKMVREGIPYSEFSKVLINYPFTLKEWSNYLNISSRTLERHRDESKSFRQEQSERILAIFQLLNYGRTVFDFQKGFYNWLNSNNIALGGIKPKELLDTNIGIGIIKDELGRIEHGILA